ncbi:MAG: hypothetical protein US50_C0001G0035 [Candidatus Nomurabacteria bacterium GW2011_GWB1_37_5]|uniref:Uncharacterized protein n=1 Tax=Candidatus Nomurabacteria bacterium GW2011_GWB1_37_5 TaxID=1618742 RepID=A0A0G0GYG8_9BACT|nr:MAG: hypothetical protein US50_C0001G0035 [Candidatus Nomurabacteria bacterium GW2011_GWB1_37_5]
MKQEKSLEQHVKGLLNKQKEEGAAAFQNFVNEQKKKKEQMGFKKNPKIEIEEAEVVEEIPHRLPAKTKAEKVEAIEEENNEEAKMRRMQKDIIQKITKIKIRELMAQTEAGQMEEKGMDKSEGYEVFRSAINRIDTENVKIPKDHPLIPILKWAESLLEENKKGKIKLSETVLIKNGKEEKLAPTIETALNRIFYPIYSGEGKVPEGMPKDVKEIITLIKRSSEEHQPLSVFRTTSKIGGASFNLICNFGDNFKHKGIKEVLKQFENDITS